MDTKKSVILPETNYIFVAKNKIFFIEWMTKRMKFFQKFCQWKLFLVGMTGKNKQKRICWTSEIILWRAVCVNLKIKSYFDKTKSARMLDGSYKIVILDLI